MKRKPLWGLWLLVIVMPFAVFVGITEKQKLRDKSTRDEITFDHAANLAAAQGMPHLSNLRLSPSTNNSGYSARLSVFNPIDGKPSVNGIVLSGSSEILQTQENRVIKDGDALDFGHFGCRGSLYCDVTICNIKTLRQKSIRLRIYWITPDSSGRYIESQKDIVITPQMKP